jgi:hypothetical protein
MNSKTVREDRSCDDIAFLYEIIADFRFWQVSIICTLLQIRVKYLILQFQTLILWMEFFPYLTNPRELTLLTH